MMMINFLKTLIWMVVPILLAAFPGEDAVISALPRYETSVFYTTGEFQDFTDYGVFTYDSLSADDLTATGYFSEADSEDVAELLAYVANFEEWVAAVGGELEENYDFDASVVSEGDYFYIDTKYDPEGVYSGKFDHYTIYFFDVEQMTLYYFHSNI